MLDDAPEEPTAKFRDLLLGMSYADFRVRRLLDLEGLKQWLPGRMEGYQALEGAVRPFGTIASFLLSVMGEGTFLTLLRFLERHAPDPVTRSVTHLAANDEARHVAFGVAHLRESAKQDASLLDRLALSVHRRHDALRHAAGLNQEVLDALVLVAAGGWERESPREGSRLVAELIREMDQARRGLLQRVGFADEEAAKLSGLHTRNFT